MGTRLAEETEVKPKPMVEIGGYPILWHIMMHYWTYGFREFAIALGYKGDYIKRYMLEYASMGGDLLVRTGNGGGQAVLRRGPQPDWEVALVETGDKTLTGGRIKRLGPVLGGQTFCLTWGDGVANVNLAKLIAFHRAHGKLATVTAVRPPARFGHMLFDGDRVVEFQEKPQTAEGWINGAFFVLEPEVLGFIDGDDTMWENEPMRRLAEEGQLMAYRHEGFWACMDTIRDKRMLNELWQAGNAPWKTWKD
jgi:glucose-1-phosphate cytidylyltransferase